MSGEGVIRNQPLIHAPLSLRLRSGGAQAKDKAFITCPKCGAPMFVRDSMRHNETVKHLMTHCTNTGCGLTGMHELVFVHFFNPGLVDRPDLDLTACPRDKIPHILPPPRDDGDPDQMTMFAPPT